MEVSRKFDKGWIGFFSGLTAPLFSLFLFYLSKYSHLTFLDFYNDVLVANQITVPVISLCVITNLLVFFIFIWTNCNRASKGVLFATFIYLGYVFYQKQIR